MNIDVNPLLSLCTGLSLSFSAVAQDCNTVYEDLVRKHGHDYVSCMSDVTPELETCELPEGLTDQADSASALRIVIALDASGSMAGVIDGGQKMDIAREAIRKFSDAIPQDTKVGLLVYGHRGSNKASGKQESCSAIEMVYPLQLLNMSDFSAAIDSINPTGWTPIEGALNQAGNVLASDHDSTNIIYLVSDGIETCGGDPVNAATALQAAEVKTVINVIGFDVDDVAQQQLRDVALAGGGDYVEARDAEELNAVFSKKRLELGAWGDYTSCVRRNRIKTYQLLTEKRFEIRECLTSKNQSEFKALQKERQSWDSDDERKACFRFVRDQSREKFDRIKRWRTDVLDALGEKRDKGLKALSEELEKAAQQREDLDIKRLLSKVIFPPAALPSGVIVRALKCRNFAFFENVRRTLPSSRPASVLMRTAWWWFHSLTSCVARRTSMRARTSFISTTASASLCSSAAGRSSIASGAQSPTSAECEQPAKPATRIANRNFFISSSPPEARRLRRAPEPPP